MEIFQLLCLSLLQGITEFLPISSSAHLILLPHLTGWQDQGLVFDVAVHFGTLIAVVFYFRKDIWALVFDWFASVAQRKVVGQSTLAWAVLLATIPVGIAGLFFKDMVETTLRSPQIIAWSTIIFALLLYWSDKYALKMAQPRTEQQLTIKDMFIIGCAQALALIPGTSRSGSTMTAGLFLGLSREASARFSFLLSIPVIVLASGLNTLELVQQPTVVDWQALIIAVCLSALSAFACITLFLKLISRVGMLPFVIYRLFLGFFLLWFFS
jgi:undecaprenyl-diphosphatase